jgi:hypothetical protein
MNQVSGRAPLTPSPRAKARVYELFKPRERGSFFRDLPRRGRSAEADPDPFLRQNQYFACHRRRFFVYLAIFTEIPSGKLAGSGRPEDPSIDPVYIRLSASRPAF